MTDFHKNIELVQRSRISPPDLVTLWQELVNRSQALAGGGQSICILPTDGSAELKGDRLRKALFWLERSGRILILRYLPDILAIQLDQVALKREAEGEIDTARVARVLSQLYRTGENPASEEGTKDKLEPDVQPGQEDEGSGWLDGAISLVRGFLGFLFSDVQSQESGTILPTPDTTAARPMQRAEIKLGTVWQRAGLGRLDDVYTALIQLQRRNALKIERTLFFRTGTYIDRAETMWSWLDEVLKLLVRPTPSQGVEYKPEDLIHPLILNEKQSGDWTEQKLRTGRNRCVRAAIGLCGVAQVRVRERFNEAQELVYRYTLPQGQHQAVERRLKRVRRLAHKLEGKLKKGAVVELADLLSLEEGRVRMQDLRAALRLLSDLGLYSTDQVPIPFSYVIQLHTDKELVAPMEEGQEEEEELAGDQEMFAQLSQVNRMAEYRAFAMELFATLPDGEMRKEFIDEYFATQDPESLFELIGRTAGQIESDELEERFEEILKKVRSEAMEKAMSQLREGEEPKQYETCTYPYGSHLLVNAGPGAGKTMVLMRRAAHLIQRQGLRPEQILILAFNRAVVHEIRSRIKELFDQLGYGAYVRRLQVFTFHAFALRYMRRTQQEQSSQEQGTIDEVLETFVGRCIDDLSFAQEVSRGVKAILVDEFQDMNDERYAFLLSLQEASGAGLMVIGDDDQDILRWNRKGKNKVEVRTYFERFMSEERLSPKVINLTVNFRSDAEVVSRSQGFIVKFLDGVSQRVKYDVLLKSRSEAGQGIVEQVKITAYDHVCQTIAESIERSESYAILCLRNVEAYKLYEQIRKQFPSVQVQGQEDLRIVQLRHIGLWCDVCISFLDRAEDERLSPALREKLKAIYAETGIPEAHKEGELEVDVGFLWDAHLAENPQATLQDHIEFIQDLRIDDYVRMRGRTELKQWKKNQAPIVISTIHKVKGLEFDTVTVLRSNATFPFSKEDRTNLPLACADEARLYYVAMTRAKKRLFLKWGLREKYWSDVRIVYEGESAGAYLKGSPGEIYISFPGYEQKRQDYIGQCVQVDNELELKRTGNTRYSFAHKGYLIGHFTKKMSMNIHQNIQGSTPILRIHAVYRYPVNEKSIEEFPKIIESCQKQGWLYTVLVSGIID